MKACPPFAERAFHQPNRRAETPPTTSGLDGDSRPLARAGSGTDFPTLGVDQNGIYLSVLQLVSGQIASNIVVAIKKPEIYQGTNLSVFANVPTNEVFGIIQPAVNFDDTPRGGYAWFIAKQPRTNASPYLGGSVAYRRLAWSGTNASWADTNWVALTNASYRDYFDLDDGDVRAPQTNGSPTIRLNQTGSRLMMAVIRDGALWTCHHVGLSGTNGSYSGDATGTNVDRSGAQWLKLTTDTNGNYLTITNSRYFDTNSIAPYWYYFPSVMVNKVGDMVAGFSGSRSNGYIGAFYSYRAAGGTNANQLRVLQSGKGRFNSNRWGDYSYTSLDPIDSLSFWTIQQYAEDDELDNTWGTRGGQIVPSAVPP